MKLRDYVLDEVQVPLIIFAGSTSAKIRTTHPLFIRLSRSNPLLSAGLARWLAENPIVSGANPRWACIHSDYVYGVGVCNGFKQVYEQTGDEIGRVPIPLKTINKKKESVQLSKLKPDFALAVFLGAEADTFYRDYYRFKVNEKIPLVALFTAVTPKRLKSYEKTLAKYGTGVGLITATDYTPTASNPANQHFVAQYKKAYNALPDSLAMRGYDGGRLFVKALVELQGKWDGHKVVHLMKTLPYTSPRHGQQLQFDTHGDVINSGYIFKTKRNGDHLFNEVIGQLPAMNMDEVLK